MKRSNGVAVQQHARMLHSIEVGPAVSCEAQMDGSC
jgi:hypothetical protein